MDLWQVQMNNPSIYNYQTQLDLKKKGSYFPRLYLGDIIHDV